MLALPRRDEVRAGVVGRAAAGALDGVRPRHVPPDRGRRDAYRKLLVGASAVQVYSVLVYEGPGLASRMRKELVDLLSENRYRSLEDVLGADHEDICWRRREESGLCYALLLTMCFLSASVPIGKRHRSHIYPQ